MGHKLYKLLLQPAANEISKAKQLLICADGPLHNLPFATLNVSKNRYLIEEKPVSYILSATVLSKIVNKKSSLETDSPFAKKVSFTPSLFGEKALGT